MKLQTKTILFYLIVSLPILVVVSCISYFSFRRTISENLNEVLLNKKNKAEQLIDKFKEPQNLCLSFDSLATIKIDTTNGKGHKFHYYFKMDPMEGEQVVYRTLKSYYHSNGHNYLITVTEPQPESDGFIESLLENLLISIFFIAAGFLLINWIISRTLWRPFYKILDQLEKYDVKNKAVITPVKTSTKEFRQLNDAFLKMTGKVYSDFISQKEFTENASHETQTPLAVIKARLDLLMQSPNMKENEMKQLESIEQAVVKLSSLNKALLLLAKIENNQFNETEEVNVNAVLVKTLSVYEDMIASKNIHVVNNINPGIKIRIHPLLADILVGNLVQNAIRHNKKDGILLVESLPHSFSIANSGEPLTMDPERLFERFKKNDSSKESIGLGLAIVKSIADAYGYNLSYSFRDNVHKFKLEF